MRDPLLIPVHMALNSRIGVAHEGLSHFVETVCYMFSPGKIPTCPIFLELFTLVAGLEFTEFFEYCSLVVLVKDDSFFPFNIPEEVFGKMLTRQWRW